MTTAAEMDRLMHYDDMVARIYADERMPHETREVALAMAWVLQRDPDRPRGKPFWTHTKKLLGCDAAGYWRLSSLIAGDAPRYEQRWRYSAVRGECEGPRLRPYRPRSKPQSTGCLIGHHPHIGTCRFTRVYVNGDNPPPEHDNTICGARGYKEVIERDPATGWHRSHWFCRRHLERASEVQAQYDATGEAPEPIPNVGGLLPRYFKADWVAIYTRHCERAHRHWEPPYYGVDADDWPVPGRQLIPKRPRLSVVAEQP